MDYSYLPPIQKKKERYIFGSSVGFISFSSSDLSIVWIKSAKGEIKTYELSEIIPKDEKDLQIEFLQSQIEELRKEMKNNEQYISNDDETSTSKNDGAIGKSTKKSQSTSIQDVSGSKTK